MLPSVENILPQMGHCVMPLCTLMWSMRALRDWNTLPQILHGRWASPSALVSGNEGEICVRTKILEINQTLQLVSAVIKLQRVVDNFYYLFAPNLVKCIFIDFLHNCNESNDFKLTECVIHVVSGQS